MTEAERKFNEKIAVLLLFLPLAMHWLLPEGPVWEQRFTTITFGSFRFSWIVIFYVFYYFSYTKHSVNSRLRKVFILFLFAFVICPIPLVLVNHGDYAIGLFLSSIPFFLAPCILISKPPQRDSLRILKYPLFFVLIVTIYFYFHAVRETLNVGFGVDERPTTLVGSVNISSFFLVILTCFISELYLKSELMKFSLLLFVLGLSLVGACRGAVLFMGLYILFMVLKSYKKTAWYVKVLLILTIASSVYFAYTSNLFQFLEMRNEELSEQGGGDFTSGRGERIAYVLDKAYSVSPIIGVGHGRVFPSSKDLLVQRDERKFNYSIYAGAPHNAFVVAFAEYGVIGIILVIIGVIHILKSLDYRNNLSYIVLLMLFVMGNTEAILIQDDFWPLLWIIVALSTKKHDINKKICQYGNTSVLPTSISSHSA